MLNNFSILSAVAKNPPSYTPNPSRAAESSAF